MTPTTSAMIERALELDEKATPAPWRGCAASDSRCSCGLIWAGDHTTIVASTCVENIDVERPLDAELGDRSFIAESRSLLPILARALRVAVEALNQRCDFGVLDKTPEAEALSKIEAICEGKA